MLNKHFLTENLTIKKILDPQIIFFLDPFITEMLEKTNHHLLANQNGAFGSAVV